MEHTKRVRSALSGNLLAVGVQAFITHFCQHLPMQRKLPYCINQLRTGLCTYSMYYSAHTSPMQAVRSLHLLQEKNQCSGKVLRFQHQTREISSFSVLLQFHDSESQKVPLKIRNMSVDKNLQHANAYDPLKKKNVQEISQTHITCFLGSMTSASVWHQEQKNGGLWCHANKTNTVVTSVLLL